MAPNATNHQPGRTARVLHWLFPSRTIAAITLTVEIGLTALGLPLWAHVLVAVLLHLLAGVAAWLW
jgi:hypothetical protein